MTSQEIRRAACEHASAELIESHLRLVRRRRERDRLPEDLVARAD
jgi:hypothetical protein